MHDHGALSSQPISHLFSKGTIHPNTDPCQCIVVFEIQAIASKPARVKLRQTYRPARILVGRALGSEGLNVTFARHHQTITTTENEAMHKEFCRGWRLFIACVKPYRGSLHLHVP